LAAGFGYNYRFDLPSIDKVSDCPLVKVAEGNHTNPNPATIAGELSEFLISEPGSFFVAAGIQFTVFKQIDAFLLVIISQDGDVEFIGKATVTVPSEARKPLAIANFVMVGTIDSDGIFVQGEIAEGSYILFPECKIRGGFAFYSWTSGPHEGDFVFSIGGYHPKFRVPSHYPRLERVNFRYSLSRYIKIKGDLYFTLTSTALMAGGRFEATFDESFGFFYVKAFFVMRADFIISWLPYYYEGEISISLGGEIGIDFKVFSENFKVSLGADLKVWGPDFAGKGKVTYKNWIKNVSFGIKFGNQDSKKPGPVEWDDFKGAFIPIGKRSQRHQPIQISISQGLLQETEFTPKAIVDPNNFQVLVDTLVPISGKFEFKDTINKSLLAGDTKETQVGIAPMDIENLKTSFKVSINSKEFDCRTVITKFPKALWGQGLRRKPSLRAPQSLQALGRVEITPKEPTNPGVTKTIPCKELAYEIENATEMGWKPFINIEKSPEHNETKRGHKIAKSLLDDQLAENRRKVLQQFGVADEEIEKISLPEFEQASTIRQSFIIYPKLTA
jgi:hypothetical protein